MRVSPKSKGLLKAIKKKLLGKSPVSQRLSLDLLETCTSNCEKVFSEVASEKVLDDMMKVIDDPKTDHENRVKAMQLIRAWGESEDLMYLPVFHQTYSILKTRAIPSGMPDNDAPPMQYPLGTFINQDPSLPPESYPIPEMGLHSADILTSHGGQSVEEKREFLVVTRNTLDIFSSILNSEDEPKPVKNEPTVSMFENCKQSLPVVQGIILFKLAVCGSKPARCASKVISRYEQMEAAIESGGNGPKHIGSGVPHPDESDTKLANNSLTQVGNQNDFERSEFPEVGNAGSSSEIPKTVVSEKDGVGGAKERET